MLTSRVKVGNFMPKVTFCNQETGGLKYQTCIEKIMVWDSKNSYLSGGSIN